MSTYIIDDTKTMLMMNQDRWTEASKKFFHNFDETLSFEERGEIFSHLVSSVLLGEGNASE